LIEVANDEDATRAIVSGAGIVLIPTALAGVSRGAKIGAVCRKRAAASIRVSGN
jgi:hypothetical protein